MTPELKNACEVVFQEHKGALHPVAWNRDVFRGRLSTGLSEMAKETLLQKNIIRFPNPAKKNHTVINPAVAMAGSYEEAEDIVLNRVPALAVHTEEERPVSVANTVSDYIRHTTRTPDPAPVNGNAETIHEPIKWYLKPVFVYLVWPVLGALAGGLITWLIGEAFTGLMFDFKK